MTVILAGVAILVISALVAVKINQSRNCHDIIGDGHVMGADPKPVVIGNSCEL